METKNPNTVEVSFTGGPLALNRLLMTIQNKRMPVSGFTLGHDRRGMRATLIFDCPPEAARRYAMILSALEDVQNVEAAEESVTVVLLKVSGDGWKESAATAGIAAHEGRGTVVASGEPEKLESWLSGLDRVRDLVRLGPLARPGNGGE